MQLKSILSFLFVITVLWSCTGTNVRQVPSNSAQFFRDGYPEVTLQAFGLVSKDKKSSVHVFVRLKLGSIITQLDETGEKKGKILLEIQLEGPNIGQNGRVTKGFDIDLSEQIKTNPNGDFEFNQSFYTNPGPCKVIVQITDEQSQKISTVLAETIIPNYETNKPTIGSILYLVKEPGTKDYVPHLTSAFAQRFDSVRFYAQFLPGNKTLLSAVFTLERYTADSVHARRLFEPDVLPGNIAYMGIDYRSAKAFYKKEIKLDSAKSQLYELNEVVKLPKIGNYKASLSLQFKDTTQIIQMNDFTVKPSYFPEVKTARELAEPLIYLMDDKDYEKMMQIKNTDSLKKAVDLFWLNFIGNPRIARQSLALYYERVEYANRYFTTFKEGWKTDPGMIYILWGSPRIVDQLFRDVFWAYGMYQNNTLYDPEQTFLFIRVQTQMTEMPFEHYLLRRSPNYFQTNYRMIDLWRTGLNLQR